MVSKAPLKHATTESVVVHISLRPLVVFPWYTSDSLGIALYLGREISYIIYRTEPTLRTRDEILRTPKLSIVQDFPFNGTYIYWKDLESYTQIQTISRGSGCQGKLAYFIDIPEPTLDITEIVAGIK